MLARDQRLRNGRDIRRVYARGRFGASRGLTVKALPNHLPLSRGVVVVGRKISGKAVVRNRIRRRLAAALAQIWQTVPPGYDIVVTVGEDTSSWSATVVQQNLTKGLNRSLAIKPNRTKDQNV